MLTKKGKTAQIFTEIKQILEIGALKHVSLSFDWNRRSTDLLQLADDLSKSYSLTLTDQGLKKLLFFMRKKQILQEFKFPFFHCPWSLHETLSLNIWSPRIWKRSGSIPLLIIHPVAPNSQHIRIFELLKNIQFQGILLTKNKINSQKCDVWNLVSFSHLCYLKRQPKIFHAPEKFYQSNSSYSAFFVDFSI